MAGKKIITAVRKSKPKQAGSKPYKETKAEKAGELGGKSPLAVARKAQRGAKPRPMKLFSK